MFFNVLDWASEHHKTPEHQKCDPNKHRAKAQLSLLVDGSPGDCWRPDFSVPNFSVSISWTPWLQKYPDIGLHSVMVLCLDWLECWPQTVDGTVAPGLPSALK